MNTTTTGKRIGIIVLLIVVVIILAVIETMRAPRGGSVQNQTPGTIPPVTTQTTDATTPISTVSYSCDAGKMLTAAFYYGPSTPAASADQPPVPGGSVMLTLNDGSTMKLMQSISADGARYANADGSFVFWAKGNGALILENNAQKTYIGCIVASDASLTPSLKAIYSNSGDGFSIRLPSLASTTAGKTASTSWMVDSSYKYQSLGPGKDIYGVKFTIPSSLAQGTNLSKDSYISVEELTKSQIGSAQCSAALFVSPGSKVATLDDAGRTYSVASSTDAGAGNRYQETVYAIPGTNPCVAVRYFVHYSAIENYPAGQVKQFDSTALMSQFGQIRRTLVLDQVPS